MSYSHRNNSFISHLTQREYVFNNRDEKRGAMERMLREDAEVRDAAQKRAQDAGVTKPLSDREISQGSFMPDRRTTVERVADEALKNGAKHDPFTVAIDTVRAKMRSTDSPDKRATDEATIARLEQRSAELAQQRAANPVVEIDPTKPAANAAALREAAAQVADSFAGTADDRARNQRRAAALLKRADAEDAKASAEQERAAKLKTVEPWIADCDATLFLIEKDSSIPQETVNSVRAMREKLANLEATGDEWIAFANSVDAKRKQIKESKLAANDEARKELEQIREFIRARTDTTPPAGPPVDPPNLYNTDPPAQE
jgi:hypothetical protein